MDKVFTPNKTINLYIAFEIKSWPLFIDDGFALKEIHHLGLLSCLQILILINILILDMVVYSI